MRSAMLTACAFVLSISAAMAGEAWQPAGLGGSGGMFSLAVSPLDPRLMMVNCDMSGAYMSRDGGRTWKMIHHKMLAANTRCCPVFHPTMADRIYAVSGWGGELRVSDDAGVTWRALLKVRPPWTSPIGLLYVALVPADAIQPLPGSSLHPVLHHAQARAVPRGHGPHRQLPPPRLGHHLLPPRFDRRRFSPSVPSWIKHRHVKNHTIPTYNR